MVTFSSQNYLKISISAHALAKMIVLKQDATSLQCSGKKAKLWCYKCIFHQIKTNLAEIQPKNHQNVQKCIYCKKLQESMG